MLLVSKYTAIKQLVSSYLVKALSIYTNENNLLEVSQSNIALFKSKETCKVLYISGVAQKLAKAYHASASTIASQVASHFYNCGDLQIKLVEGWIHIEVADSVVAACLQSVTSLNQNLHFHPNTLPPEHTPTRTNLFPVQYAHARCCSLLRLAQREGLISFADPLQIPWLNQGKLRFNQLQSQRLINNLVGIVDDLVCVDSVSHWDSSAHSLSQAFEGFWCTNQIWGELKTFPELAYASLGLIVATQRILKLLLEDKLGIVAWTEL